MADKKPTPLKTLGTISTSPKVLDFARSSGPS
jgi:hypothetical protein